MHSLYKQTNLPYLNVKLCPNCKHLVPLNNEICPSCEYNFSSRIVKTSAEKTEYKEPVKETIVKEELPKVEVKVAQKFVFCDNCGAKIIGSQKYCGGCGAKVSKIICPGCDQIIDGHLIFCPLCGEKIQEPSPQLNNTNVNTSNTYEYKQQQTTVDNKGDEIKTNNETINVEKVEQTNDDEIKVEEKVEEVIDTPLDEVVNVGRKRLFTVLQLLVVILIAAIMVAVPILTSEFFISEMWNCFKGESQENLISFKSLFDYFKNVEFKIFDINSELLTPLLTNEEGKFLFSDAKIINRIFNDSSALKLKASYLTMLCAYGGLIVSMLIVFVTSIISFCNKRPLKGRSLGLFTIVLFGCVVLIFMLNTLLNDGFKKYDSWLTYAFFISFVLWMIIKIIFFKENRKYKTVKRQLKEAKKMR